MPAEPIRKVDVKGEQLTVVQNTTSVPTEGSSLPFNCGGAYNFFDGSYGKQEWQAKLSGTSLGLSWIQSSLTEGGNIDVSNLSYVRGLFFCNTSLDVAYYSSDALMWYPTNLTHFNQIYYLDGFVAVDYSGVYHSYDGITWASVLTQNIADYIFNDVSGLVRDSSSAWYSTDGITWASVLFPSANVNFSSGSQLRFLGGYWLLRDSDNLAYRSADTSSWVSITLPTDNNTLDDLNYGNSIWLANSEDAEIAYYSLNGVEWSQCTVDSPSSYHVLPVSRAIFDRGVWYCRSYVSYNNGRLWWELPTTSSSPFYYNYAIAGRANNLLVGKYRRDNWAITSTYNSFIRGPNYTGSVLYVMEYITRLYYAHGVYLLFGESDGNPASYRLWLQYAGSEDQPWLDITGSLASLDMDFISVEIYLLGGVIFMCTYDERGGNTHLYISSLSSLYSVRG